MRLPSMKQNVPIRNSEIVTIRGINYTDNYGAGALAETQNISARRYPYFSTRRDRRKINEYSGVTAVTSWEDLIVVAGGTMYYDGREISGSLTDGPKQFAVVNTKLVIWPDKKYLDLKTRQLKSLGASLTLGDSYTKTWSWISSSEATGAGANALTISGLGESLRDYFSAGDAIWVTGSRHGSPAGAIIVSGVHSDYIVFDLDSEDETFSTGVDAGTIRLQRKIPNLDYICAAENRLWGCCSEDQTIYGSALGDPSNFFDYSGESTDAYAVAVGSEGPFTGCCKLNSSVLFFKDHTLHKLLGSYPAEYQVYTYQVEGVQEGCSKSMQVINDTLFYVSSHGVYTYSGSGTSYLSAAIGDKHYTDAVAGSDGKTYYLSVLDTDDGKYDLLTYDIRTGIWCREDDTHAVDFARVTKELYFVTADGDLFLADAGTEDDIFDWSMTFKPFYETRSGSYNRSVQVFEKKRYNHISLRMELKRGARVHCAYRCDDGEWVDAGFEHGKQEGVLPFEIVTPRCDRFEIRLFGSGHFALLGMKRDYTIGSERR